MAIRAGIQIWPDHLCLLSELAKEISLFDRDKIDNIIVVLPTQRLITSLLAILAKRFGAMVPPHILTLEQFVSRSAPSKDFVQQTVSPLASEVLIASLIRERPYKHLSPGQEHEIKQFFGDLAENDIGELGFERLDRLLEGDQYRDGDHLASLKNRMNELRDLYTHYHAALLDQKRVSSNDLLAQDANSCLQQWQDLEAMPHEWVYVSCFTTLRPYFQPLLAMLNEKDNCSIWMSQPPKIISRLNPLAELYSAISRKTLQEGQDTRIPIGSGIDPNPKRCVRVHSSPNALSEVAQALELAQEYIAQGFPPSQIAILLTNEARYSKIIRSFVKQKLLKANLAVSTPLSQTSLGVWVLALLDFLSPAQDRAAHALSTFCLHPLCLAFFRKNHHGELTTQRTVGGDVEQELLRAQLLQALESAIATAQRSESGLSLASIKNQLRDLHLQNGVKKLERLLQVMVEAAETVNGREQQLNLGSWVEILENVLDGFGLWEQSYEEDKGVLSSSLAALAELLDSLAEAGSLHDTVLAASEFGRLIKDKIMSLETRSIGYPLEGIQILSLIEARYVPFQVVMILGCIEGQFPKALPKDHLIDDWFKAQIGLPAWLYVEALEDLTFHLLKSRIPHLELSYPREISGEHTVRSRFVEKVLCEESDVTYTKHSGTAMLGFLQAELAPLEEQQLVEDCQLSYQKNAIRVEELAKTTSRVSASLLESLFACPYQFLFKKMSLDESQVDPLDPRLRPGGQAAVEGTYLHKILEVFYSGKDREKKYFEPLPKQIPKSQWHSFGQQRLQAITQSILPLGPESLPLKAHLKHFSWPRLLRFLERWYSSGREHDDLVLPDIELAEWRLGQGQGVKFDAKKMIGVTPVLDSVLVKGVVDRIELDDSKHVILDYKRKFIPAQSHISEGNSPQLSLYLEALCHDEFLSRAVDREKTALVYWSILDGKEKIVAVGEKVQQLYVDQGFASKKTPLTTEVVAAMNQRWSSRLQHLVENDHAFSPESGKGCTFCNFSGLCRKEDPETKARMRQKKLTEQDERQAGDFSQGAVK